MKDLENVLQIFQLVQDCNCVVNTAASLNETESGFIWRGIADRFCCHWCFCGFFVGDNDAVFLSPVWLSIVCVCYDESRDIWSELSRNSDDFFWGNVSAVVFPYCHRQLIFVFTIGIVSRVYRNFIESDCVWHFTFPLSFVWCLSYTQLLYN